MGSQGKPTTRRYSPEFKERAVRMVCQLRAETGERHGTIQRVADQIGCGVESLCTRVNQAEIDAGETLPTHEPGGVQEEHTTSGAHRLCEQAFPDWVPNDVLQAAEDLSVDDALAERSRASGPPERGGNRFGPR